MPRSIMAIYHWFMSYGVALWYGFPARRLLVIGVTGTKGKTTVSHMIWHILQQSGLRTGLLSTALLAVGDKVWLNDLKMTMPGRLTLQRLFRRMSNEGCVYAVVETSSEGLAQSRQAGISYLAAVFTNLAPEHIEAHGSFSNYRSAKAKLFSALTSRVCLTPLGKVKPFSLINADDEQAGYFSTRAGGRVVDYSVRGGHLTEPAAFWQPTDVKISVQKMSFKLRGLAVELPFGGEFNLYNAVAALATVQELGLPLSKAIQALASYHGTPGRLEFIELGQNFKVVVDYAHTAESLEQLYLSLKNSGPLIAVLGSCGGGRDKARRRPLGRLAGQFARLVVVTNEDPYDEDPLYIMEEVAAGAKEAGKEEGNDLVVEPDRRRAIALALSQAKSGEIVVITGKGSEQWLCVANNKKIPWDDRQVVREELGKMAAGNNKIE